MNDTGPTTDALLATARAEVAESLQTLARLDALLPVIADLAAETAARLRRGGRVYFFGNGGSAADAQHWAAELSGRFYVDRPALPAFALGMNASEVTAIGNDYGYADVFARPLRGFAGTDDVAVGISTSGNSENVVRALETAREKGALAVGFTGEGGGKMADVVDVLIAVPSRRTPRIQEAHEVLGHALCGLIEQSLFGAPDA
ncbi:MAG TPA: SIS domain-containing protein [Rhodothermales bacterium]|nr:SIS domain-containing protein [Rhodothermales bacterium]